MTPVSDRRTRPSPRSHQRQPVARPSPSASRRSAGSSPRVYRPAFARAFRPRGRGRSRPRCGRTGLSPTPSTRWRRRVTRARASTSSISSPARRNDPIQEVERGLTLARPEHSNQSWVDKGLWRRSTLPIPHGQSQPRQQNSARARYAIAPNVRYSAALRCRCESAGSAKSTNASPPSARPSAQERARRTAGRASSMRGRPRQASRFRGAEPRPSSGRGASPCRRRVVTSCASSISDPTVL